MTVKVYSRWLSDAITLARVGRVKSVSILAQKKSVSVLTSGYSEKQQVGGMRVPAWFEVNGLVQLFCDSCTKYIETYKTLPLDDNGVWTICEDCAELQTMELREEITPSQPVAEPAQRSNKPDQTKTKTNRSQTQLNQLPKQPSKRMKKKMSKYFR